MAPTFSNADRRMSNPARPVHRRRSVPVAIGAVTVGGRHPVVVQSMTNTDTADAVGTAV